MKGVNEPLLVLTDFCSSHRAVVAQCWHRKDKSDEHISLITLRSIAESSRAGCPICVNIVSRGINGKKIVELESLLQENAKLTCAIRFDSQLSVHGRHRGRSFKIFVDVHGSGDVAIKLALHCEAIEEVPALPADQPRIAKSLPETWLKQPSVEESELQVSTLKVQANCDEPETRWSASRIDDIVMLCRNWLNWCESNDYECRSRRDKSWRPTRLVHIRYSQSSGAIEAAIVEAALGHYRSNVRYFTLSHRWLNAESETKLCAGNLQRFRIEIPLRSLKASVRDAILLCAKMNVPYLWVDSLCILQDNDAERGREILLMHQIYGNALCNIAASESTQADVGMFDSQSSAASANYAVFMDVSPELRGYYRVRTAWDSTLQEINKNILSTRGWIFQERFLSPRIIHFCANQVYWECRSRNASETYTRGPPLGDAYDNDSANVRSVLREWHHRESYEGSDEQWHLWFTIVERYTLRILSFDHDRLDGIAGVAAFCANDLKFGPNYSYGIWGESLPEALLWECPRLPAKRRRLDVVAPSWSWGSISGPVEYERGLCHGHSIHLRTAESADDLSNDSGHQSDHKPKQNHAVIRGAGSDKVIWVKGKLWEITGDFSQTDKPILPNILPANNSGLEILKSEATLDETQLSTNSFYLPVIMKWDSDTLKPPYNGILRGLLLAPVNDVSRSRYQRIGVCNLDVRGQYLETHHSYPVWRPWKPAKRIVLPGIEHIFCIA